MATASITSSVSPVVSPTTGLNRNPKTDHSRDDLEVADVVSVTSAAVGTSYAWSLAYTPPGSTATLSGVLGAGPHTFTVDKEGPYLIQLQFTDATGTTEQFVRLRALTEFGSLKLVSAGEQYGTLRVPVDITFEGWADEQNVNILTLLGLVEGQFVTTRTLFVDPEGSDTTKQPFRTIQAAVAEALSSTPTPSVATPWVVVVRPGVYSENLTLSPWVHIVGAPNSDNSGMVEIRNASLASQTLNVTNPNDQIRLSNLRFLQTGATTNDSVTSNGQGSVFAYRCEFIAQGNSGVAYRASANSVLTDCRLVSGTVNPTDFALRVSGAEASLNRCEVSGQSGIWAEINSEVRVLDSDIQTTGTWSVETYADSFGIQYSRVSGPIAANFAGTGTPVGTPLGLSILWSEVSSVQSDGSNVGTTANLSIGSSTHGALSVTNGAVLEAGVPADTVFYDNALFPANYPTSPAPALSAENVQEAIDEVYNYASEVRTLDDAYDGGTPGPTGSGRDIVADAGSVRILDAASPSDPIPPGNTDGGLDVVGFVRVGAIDKPEITFDPNPFGNGPEILLGKEIWANDAPYGSTPLVIGDSSGSPTFHNYNLRVATQSAAGGDHIGSLFFRAGDAYSNIDAGSVYLQAGFASDVAGGAEGNIYLTPGEAASGATGALVLNRPETATPATLGAAGAWVGGVAGAVLLGTDFGGVRVEFDGTETLPQTLTKLSASGHFTATEAAGVIVLTTTGKGGSSEVFFLSAEAGLNTSLGDFSLVGGATFTPGTWADAIEITTTSLNEITFGRSGAAGPMVYNAETGNLSVPGIITDTDGVVFDEAGPPGTGPNKGALFIADGSAGTNQNHPYFEADDGTLYDLLQGLEGAATLRKDFAFNSASPFEITGLVPGDMVVQVFLRYTTAFDDPAATVSVGTDSAPTLYLDTTDTDPSLADSIYTVTTMEEVALVENAVITINPAGSTIGAGTVVVVVHRYGSIPTPASTTSLMVAGEPIQKGDVVLAYYDGGFAEVRVKRADADAILLYERTAYGIAGAAGNTSDQIPVITVPGVNTFMRFDVPPSSGDVGQPVYLNRTPGEVTLSAPTISGSSVYRVGFLYLHLNGSGVPVVTFQPQFIAEIP